MSKWRYRTEPWVQSIQRVHERSIQAQGSLIPAPAVTVPITAGHTSQATVPELAQAPARCSPGAALNPQPQPPDTASEEVILKTTHADGLQSCVLSLQYTGFCSVEFWMRACSKTAISPPEQRSRYCLTSFRKSILSCLKIPFPEME